MTTLPQLTEDDIRLWTDERSFGRGGRYFYQGHILNPRRQGNRLRARCWGSRPQPYHVEIDLGPDGIRAGACSCPVGAGGHCKHAVALLLTWVHEPESFTSVEDLETNLERWTKSELIVLVRRMLERYPDLEGLLDLPIVEEGKAPPPVDEAVIRRQASGAFDGIVYEDWGAPYAVAQELLALVGIGDDYAAAERWDDAGTIYRIVMEKALHGYGMVHDEGGELHEVVDACVSGLGACLVAIEDPVERAPWVRALFDVYRWDAEFGGIEMGYAAPGIILDECTVEEKEQVAGWVRAAIPAGDSWGEGYLRQGYGGFLLGLEEGHLDDEGYLRICRETGRLNDLVDRLLALGRVDEAVAAAGEAGDYTLLGLADVFAAYDRDGLAESLIRARPPSSRDKRLSVWLKERAQERGDYEEALHLAQELFWRRPELDRYREMRGMARSLGRWEPLRAAVLSRLDAEGQHSLLVEIYVEEGEIDQALETLHRWQSASRWSRAADRLSMRVARAAEKERPRAAIRLYLEAVAELIARRGRGNYAVTATHLIRVRDLYRRLGEETAWEALIAGVREENPRLRALKDELNKAGL